MKEPGGSSGVRLDKWLWAARFFKTRSLAAVAVDGGRVRVNGERAKRSRLLNTGDQLQVRLPPYTFDILVRGLSERRGPATDATQLYLETTASVEARERLRWHLRAAGNLTGAPEGERPTKRDRRKLDRLRREGGLD
jgi:ribosome-associated heat shock protein Hsp15